MIIYEILIAYTEDAHQRGSPADPAVKQVAGRPQTQGEIGGVRAAERVKITEDRATVLIGTDGMCRALQMGKGCCHLRLYPHVGIYPTPHAQADDSGIATVVQTA